MATRTTGTVTTDDLARQANGLSQGSEPEELIGWGSGLADHRDAPEQMARLFEQLGPEETARLLRLTGFAADRSQSYATEMVETLVAFKTALAGGSFHMADAEGFANELGRWLLPTELSDEEQRVLRESGGLPLVGPSVLAQILRGTSFDLAFLTGLAERVWSFERSGAVDPAEYYQLMTPARYDDYRTRDVARLIADQLRRV